MSDKTPEKERNYEFDFKDVEGKIYKNIKLTKDEAQTILKILLEHEGPKMIEEFYE